MNPLKKGAWNSHFRYFVFLLPLKCGCTVAWIDGDQSSLEKGTVLGTTSKEFQ